MTISASLISAVGKTLDTTAQLQEKVVGEDIYVVLAVTLIVWVGIFSYIIFLDRKVNSLLSRTELEEKTVSH